MKCLVTGGAGFLGSHVADALLAAGDEVVVLDDLSGGFRDNVPEGAAFVEGSICDHKLVDRLFADHRFEAVFHLAAYAAEVLSPFIRRFNYENNLVGSANLVNAAVNHGTRCFVFTSSIAVYGSAPTPMTEDMPTAPMDPYGIAKAAVEQDLRAARSLFGMETVAFRPHNVYGERQNLGDRYRNVVGIFMNQLMRGEPLSVFGDGEQTRAFSYVGDVAPVIASAARTPESWGETFNLGSDDACSVNELAQAVCRACGAKTSLKRLDARHEVVHAHASHEKVHRVFPASRVSTPLDEGLARMAAWARDHGARESGGFDEIEVEKQLPSIWRRQGR